LPRWPAGRPAEIDQFLGAFAGLVPIEEYLAPGNVLRILGGAGLLRLAQATVRHALRPHADVP
jgi:hypothetical protein